MTSRTAEPVSQPRAFASAVLALYFMTAVPLGLLFFWGGDATYGLGPYLDELRLGLSSRVQAALYIPTIFVYSVIWELLARKYLQASLSKVMAAHWAIVPSAFIYASIHIRYGVPQCVSALCIGLLGGISFHHHQDWRINAAWHVSWNLTAVAVGSRWLDHSDLRTSSTNLELPDLSICIQFLENFVT